MKIYKYNAKPATLDSLPAIEFDEIPVGATFMRLGYDPRGHLCAWFEVDICETATESYRFFIVGTGWSVPSDAKYVTTLLDGSYVWHYYMQEKANESRPTHQS